MAATERFDLLAVGSELASACSVLLSGSSDDPAWTRRVRVGMRRWSCLQPAGSLLTISANFRTRRSSARRERPVTFLWAVCARSRVVARPVHRRLPEPAAAAAHPAPAGLSRARHIPGQPQTGNTSHRASMSGRQAAPCHRAMAEPHRRKALLSRPEPSIG